MELIELLKGTDLVKDKGIQKYIKDSESEQRSYISMAKTRVLSMEPWATSMIRMAGAMFPKEVLFELMDYAKRHPDKLNSILYVLVKVYNNSHENLNSEIIEVIMNIPGGDEKVIKEVKYNQDTEAKVKRANEFLSQGKFELAYKEFRWADALTEDRIQELLNGLDDKNMIVDISFKHKVKLPDFNYDAWAEECIKNYWYGIAWKCYVIGDNKEGLERLKKLIIDEANVE